MQKKLKFILGVLSCVTVVQSPAQETSLWYDAPADEWMKSLSVTAAWEPWSLVV